MRIYWWAEAKLVRSSCGEHCDSAGFRWDSRGLSSRRAALVPLYLCVSLCLSLGSLLGFSAKQALGAPVSRRCLLVFTAWLVASVQWTSRCTIVRIHRRRGSYVRRVRQHGGQGIPLSHVEEAAQAAPTYLRDHGEKHERGSLDAGRVVLACSLLLSQHHRRINCFDGRTITETP